MTEGYLDERPTTVGEGQYEHTYRLTPSTVCSSLSFFSCIFLFPFLIFSILQVSLRSTFQIEAVETYFSWGLSFLVQIALAPSPQYVLLMI